MRSLIHIAALAIILSLCGCRVYQMPAPPGGEQKKSTTAEVAETVVDFVVSLNSPFGWGFRQWMAEEALWEIGYSFDLLPQLIRDSGFITPRPDFFGRPRGTLIAATGPLIELLRK